MFCYCYLFVKANCERNVSREERERERERERKKERGIIYFFPGTNDPAFDLGEDGDAHPPGDTSDVHG